MAADLKTLTAFYDLDFGPVSFDFVTWLVRAMMERDARGCDRLHAVLVPKEDGLGGFSRHWGNHDEAATRWRLWHILVASCPLAGASVTLATSRAQAHSIRADSSSSWWPDGKAHFMGPIVDAARKGGRIPLLRATDAARRYVGRWLGERKVVTLTLRRQSTDQDRNTNRKAWDDFRAWLVGQGRDVIVLDDANEALAAGRGYAESDPDVRLALYERAEMNCIGNNGPQSLLEFSAAPYLAFARALGAGWAEHYRKYLHMNVGEQVPWARANQRAVFRPDTFEVLCEEFSR